MFKFIFRAIKGAFQLIGLPYILTEIAKTKKRHANAELLSFLADEIVGALARKYPGKDYLNWSVDAINQLREAGGLQNVDIAQRIIQAAIGRLK